MLHGWLEYRSCGVLVLVVLVYLWVLTIADLADPSGKFIPDGMLTGRWQAGLDLHWPYQRLPPARFWATFRKCLRRTLYTTTVPTQPADNGMDLDRPLGRWFLVPRHTWFDVYFSTFHVYWRADGKITRMKLMAGTRAYAKDGGVDTIPLEAHPIGFRTQGPRMSLPRRNIWAFN